MKGLLTVNHFFHEVGRSVKLWPVLEVLVHASPVLRLRHVMVSLQEWALSGRHGGLSLPGSRLQPPLLLLGDSPLVGLLLVRSLGLTHLQG